MSVYPVEDVFHQFAPYFTEETRRDIVNRYGNPVLLNEGLKVFTTMDSEKQRAAQEATLRGLLAVDKRQGYRGPVMQLEGKAMSAFIEKSKKVSWLLRHGASSRGVSMDAAGWVDIADVLRELRLSRK